MTEERRREILAQVFREQGIERCDGALFGQNHKCLVAMRRAEAEIKEECAENLRTALSDLEQMASAAGPFITGQAGMLAERLGKSIERARAVLVLQPSAASELAAGPHDHDHIPTKPSPAIAASIMDHGFLPKRSDPGSCNECNAPIIAHKFKRQE
jgi:hypothetical protein